MIENNNNMNSSKKSKKYFLLAISICLAVILFFILYKAIFYKSAEEQLSAIEKSLAIPDSENAAVLYNQLFEDYNESYLKPAFLTTTIDDITKTSFWSSKDYPELASWFKQNEDIFPKVFEVSKYQKCFYPLAKAFTDIFVGKREHLSPARQLVFFLIRSANNDIMEGRIDRAIEK